MSAPIPVATQLKIHELRSQGLSYAEIARLAGVSLNTANKYGRKYDEDQAIFRSPGSKITEGDLGLLRWVRESTYERQCVGNYCGVRHRLRRDQREYWCAACRKVFDVSPQWRQF